MNIKFYAVALALIVIVVTGVSFLGGSKESVGMTRADKEAAELEKADQDARTRAANERFWSGEVRESSGKSY